MMRNTERDAAGSPAVLACWGGRKAPTARTLPSHTRSDNRFPGICDSSLICGPSIRPGSSTRTTSFNLRSARRQRGRWGPLPVWTGRSRSPGPLPS